MANNLILKGSTWHARIELPSDVRHAFGNRIKLTKSLKTGSKAEAQQRKMPILTEWKAMIAEARQGMSYQEFEAQTARTHRIGQVWSEIRKEFITKYIMGEIEYDYEHFSTVKVGLIKKVEKIFADKPEEKEGWLLFLNESQKKLRELRDNNERPSTDLVWAITEKTFSLNKMEKEKDYIEKGYNKKQASELLDIFENKKTYTPKSPYNIEKLKSFATYQSDIKDISRKTIDMQLSKLTRLKKFLETNELELTFEAIHQFLDSLELSPKTKTQYLFAGNSFHRWAVKYDKSYKEKYGSLLSPFEKHDLPSQRKGRKKIEKRMAFSSEDIQDLYRRALAEGRKPLASLIQIGAYTGCRIEEICKLKPQHIIKEKGVKCLYIEEGKSDASIRKIPIHPRLESLVDGLLKNNESGYLIESAGGNKYGIRSDSLSKQFGRLKTSLGYDNRYVFHSIRKTVITLLQHADVHPLIVTAIVGHETGSITYDIYSEGASAKQKYEAIKTLPNII